MQTFTLVASCWRDLSLSRSHWVSLTLAVLVSLAATSSSLSLDDGGDTGETIKRSAGFVGMRGKKEYLLPNWQQTSLEDPNEFLVEPSSNRAQRRINHLLELLSYPAVAAAAAEKRGSSAGFLGMRGKKAYPTEEEIEDEEEEDELNKRSAGFVGMRGKKSKVVRNTRPYYYDPVLTMKARRAGFVGMRG